MVVQAMHLKLIASGLSDIGIVRQNNEDTWMELPEERFYVLADGMGGHQAGEVASKEAVIALVDAFKKSFKKSSKGLKNLGEARILIQKAIEYANSVVYKMSRIHETLRGMGTTICCIYFHEQGVVYGHVGDSRIYCLRSRELIQLSHDHSLLRELIDMGQLDEQQAGEFLYKNIITKAIGTEPFVEPTVNYSDCQAGDRYMMCTDGLTDLLSCEEIEDIMKRNSNNDEAVQKLVNRAKEKGGHDNITVVIIEVKQV